MDGTTIEGLKERNVWLTDEVKKLQSWVEHHQKSVEGKCKEIAELKKAIQDIERLNTGTNYEGRIYDITRKYSR